MLEVSGKLPAGQGVGASYHHHEDRPQEKRRKLLSCIWRGEKEKKKQKRSSDRPTGNRKRGHARTRPTRPSPKKKTGCREAKTRSAVFHGQPAARAWKKGQKIAGNTWAERSKEMRLRRCAAEEVDVGVHRLGVTRRASWAGMRLHWAVGTWSLDQRHLACRRR